MPAIFIDGDLTAPTIAGPREYVRPFPRDPDSFYFTQPFQQFAHAWVRMPLNTPHDDPDDAHRDAYLVEESDPKELGGGVFQWTRTFARIPRPRSTWEPFAYTLPGIEPEAAVIVYYILSATNAGGATTITTTSNHPFAPGDYVTMTYWAKVEREPLYLERKVGRVVRSTPTATTFTVDVISEPLQIVTWGTVQLANGGRRAFTRVVPSQVRFDYFLPGVTVGVMSEADIPILQPTTILDATGNAVETYSTSTIPTAAEYRQLVADGDPVVAEPSVLRPWMGNIVERATRYVVPL